MTFPTTEFLTSARTLANTVLRDTASLSRRTEVSDGRGGQTDTWAIVTASVACLVSPTGQSPQEQIIAARFTEQELWTIRFPAGTDVRIADRVVVGTRTFEVLGIPGRRTNEVYRRCVCEETS